MTIHWKADEYPVQVVILENLTILDLVPSGVKGLKDSLENGSDKPQIHGTSALFPLLCLVT